MTIMTGDDANDTPMPALFIGHGSPMNALESNRWTEQWAEIGRSLPRPRAILSVSAHWYINATAVTAMPTPSTIHDFFGFPKALFDVEYPAPGSPELAEEVADAVSPTWVGADRDSWGLDHGTWSVLTHMFPDADIPVVQLSIDASKPVQYHVDLGAQLTELRHRGILILGSGNTVHNLKMLDMSKAETGFDWADAYDEAVSEIMAERPGDIASLFERPDHAIAHPTADHLLPLFYIAGLAADADASSTRFGDDRVAGSLAMTSHVVAA